MKEFDDYDLFPTQLDLDLDRDAAAKERMYRTTQRLKRQRRTYIIGLSAIVVLGMLILTAAMLSTITTEPVRAVPPTTAAPEAIPTAQAAPVPTASPAKYPLTASQRDILAAIAYTEARGDGMDGMTAALFVVRNRIEDGRFGRTLEEICTPGQFHGLKNYDPTEVTEDAYKAVVAVFEPEEPDTTNGALYFCSGDPDAIKPGLKETARIGGHVFYTD